MSMQGKSTKIIFWLSIFLCLSGSSVVSTITVSSASSSPSASSLPSSPSLNLIKEFVHDRDIECKQKMKQCYPSCPTQDHTKVSMA